jgi:hypothetical protein
MLGIVTDFIGFCFWTNHNTINSAHFFFFNSKFINTHCRIENLSYLLPDFKVFSYYWGYILNISRRIVKLDKIFITIINAIIVRFNL